MRTKSQDYLKISRIVTQEYRGKLKEKQKEVDKGMFDQSTFIAWVNKISVAIIFYSLYSPGKRDAFIKKNKSLEALRKFESENRLYSNIFENAERMYL
jgi:hypothetical protein